MTVIGQLAVIAAISFSASAITWKVSGPPRRDVVCDPATLKPHEICLAQVMEKWQGKVLWIDARSRSDWETNGVPGSILWNLDANEDFQKFEADAMERLIEGPPVIVYCNEGNCGISMQVVERILKLEVTGEVYALHGGSGALKAAGLLKGSN